MIFDFRKTKTIASIIINGEPIERVGFFKLLGTIISSEAKENNTDAVVKKT